MGLVKGLNEILHEKMCKLLAQGGGPLPLSTSILLMKKNLVAPDFYSFPLLLMALPHTKPWLGPPCPCYC